MRLQPLSLHAPGYASAFAGPAPRFFGPADRDVGETAEARANHSVDKTIRSLLDPDPLLLKVLDPHWFARNLPPPSLPDPRLAQYQQLRDVAALAPEETAERVRRAVLPANPFQLDLAVGVTPAHQLPRRLTR